jgi:hypothetical protein
MWVDHAGVDVDAVGLGADADHLGAQLAEQQRRDPGRWHRARSPAPGARHAGRSARHAGLAELDVAADRLARARRLAQLFRFGGGERNVHRRFERQLGGVVELLALGEKNLMPLS